MTSGPEFPEQTLPVLEALWEQPTTWQYEDTLAKQIDLKPARLRSILAQLADRGLIQERCCQDEQPGSPRWHLYRLTTDGLAVAAVELATAAQSAGRL